MVEQFLPVVSIESNACINTKIVLFVLVIIILTALIKNVSNTRALQCIDIKKLELSNNTNIDKYAKNLNLTDTSQLTNKKENLMNADVVNMKYINRKREHKDIIGKYIEIKNNNRKKIPINKVIVINDNQEVIPLINFTTLQTKTGVIYTYILPKTETIRQIILDISIFNYFIENVKTSQVSILDETKNSIWVYNQIINTNNRYYTINISEPKIIYDRPKNLLCTNIDEDCSQEKQLIISLAENVWQS